MNRKIDTYIQDADLEIETIEGFLMPWTPRLQEEMDRGVAMAAK
jgi:hypothetical protein